MFARFFRDSLYSPSGGHPTPLKNLLQDVYFPTNVPMKQLVAGEISSGENDVVSLPLFAHM